MSFNGKWRQHWTNAWASIWTSVAMLASLLVLAAGCAVTGRGLGAGLLGAGAGLITARLARQQTRQRREVRQFAEAVRYRDFARFFTTHQTPADLRAIREDFNHILGTFKAISRERETQYHYLQNVLELVDTGILSYDLATGAVLWVNETLRKQLRLPAIKSLKSLAFRYPDLAEHLHTLPPGERRVVAVQAESAPVQMLLSASVFQTDGRRYKLIASQNISAALDEQETRAWQHLLRVMTHELMNSVAPIASLADTLQARLPPHPTPLAPSLAANESLLEDLRLGLETIQRRSAGLLRFASTYRSLSQITVPDVRPVYVRQLFDNLARLLHPTLREKSIALEISLPDTMLRLEIDPALIEQVLINLVVNAMDALRGRPAPCITLTAACTPEQQVVLKVRDNGTGIAPDVLEHIFVPFFTTKPHGSGIGLSLSKQILLLHQGALQVQSVLDQGTVFTLVFPAQTAR